MKCSLGISNFLEEISSLSHSVVFLYFFALIAEEGFLISPCYSCRSVLAATDRAQAQPWGATLHSKSGAAMAQEGPKGATPRWRSGAAAERSNQTSKGAVASLCWISRKVIPHVQGKKNPSKTVGVGKVKVKTHSHVPSLCDPMDSSLQQAPPSMGFSRQEYWSGLPFPSPGNLPHPGMNPGLPHCRQMLYCLSHQGSGQSHWNHNHRKLANLITGTTLLSISMKLSHAVWGHPRRPGHGGEVWQNHRLMNN